MQRSPKMRPKSADRGGAIKYSLKNWDAPAPVHDRRKYSDRQQPGPERTLRARRRSAAATGCSWGATTAGRTAAVLYSFVASAQNDIILIRKRTWPKCSADCPRSRTHWPCAPCCPSAGPKSHPDHVLEFPPQTESAQARESARRLEPPRERRRSAAGESSQAVSGTKKGSCGAPGAPPPSRGLPARSKRPMPVYRTDTQVTDI